MSANEISDKDRVVIEGFADKLRKRYPDDNVTVDYLNHEVYIVSEDLTYRFSYILKMYQSMNW